MVFLIMTSILFLGVSMGLSVAFGVSLKNNSKDSSAYAFGAIMFGAGVIFMFIVACSVPKVVAKYSAITGKPLAVLVVEPDGSSHWEMVDGWRERIRDMTKEPPHAAE